MLTLYLLFGTLPLGMIWLSLSFVEGVFFYLIAEWFQVLIANEKSPPI